MWKNRIIKAKQSGFSLAEFAIVLAIIGVVIGGIWALAKDMQDNLAQEKFSEQITVISKNIRAAYLSKASIDSTNVSVVMPILTNMNAFPGDMVRTVGNIQVVDSPWGPTTNPLLNSSSYNSLYVCGWAAAGSRNCSFTAATSTANVPLLAIEVLIPTQDACVKAVIKNSGPQSMPGLVDVAINGNKTVFLGNALPVPLAFAVRNCVPYNNSSPATVVDFIISPNPSGP